MKPKILDIVANKAEDTSVLHITGNEEVSGTKNFSTAPQIDGSNTAKDSDVVHKSGDTMTGTLTIQKLVGVIIQDDNIGTNKIQIDAGAFENTCRVITNGRIVMGPINNSHSTELYSGTTLTNGACLFLNGCEKEGDDAGCFSLISSKTSKDQRYTLLGNNLGSLLWKGQELPCEPGTIIWVSRSSAPSGYLTCNGGAVSKTSYARLYDALPKNSSGECVYGETTDTFNLPNLLDKVPWGGTPSTDNLYKDAGMPNITGYFGFSFDETNALHAEQASGAFFASSTTGLYKLSGSDYHTGSPTIYFNASRSSSIYGNSTTVQPPACVVLPCIKY